MTTPKKPCTSEKIRKLRIDAAKAFRESIFEIAVDLLKDPPFSLKNRAARHIARLIVEAISKKGSKKKVPDT